MSAKTFQKRVEDFVCENCGTEVAGDGYTNHCPNCLWSKHVDINPGDRANPCGGLMKPVRAEGASPDYSIIHECIKCGVASKNAIGKKDSISALISIVHAGIA